MGQKKFSQLPADASPTINDSIPSYDVDTVLTKRILVSDLITLFFNNIPTGANSPITRWSEVGFDHVVANTMVWSGDAYASTRAASMSAGTCYINGRRITVTAVSARTFTASKDTYIDVLDNLDGTGTLVYTETTNNAASASLAANSLRVGIIITGAGNIADVGSINQGQETKVLPIASSIPYQTTDSLGNLICPTDPNRRTLCQRRITSNLATLSATSATALTGVSAIFKPAAGRKYVVIIGGTDWQTAAALFLDQYIYDTNTSGTILAHNAFSAAGANGFVAFTAESSDIYASASTAKTVIAAYAVSTSSVTLRATTCPAWIKVRQL